MHYLTLSLVAFLCGILAWVFCCVTGFLAALRSVPFQAVQLFHSHSVPFFPPSLKTSQAFSIYLNGLFVKHACALMQL